MSINTVGLLGYAHKNNIGDDLMIEAVKGFVDNNNLIQCNPEATILEITNEILKTDRVLVCGGAIVNKSHGSYLKYLLIARLLGKPINFISIEIEGWPRGVKGAVQKFIFTKQNILVRDLKSYMEIWKRKINANLHIISDVFYNSSRLDYIHERSIGRFRFIDDNTNNSDVYLLPRSFNDVNKYNDEVNYERFLKTLRHLSLNMDDLNVYVSPSAAIDNIDVFTRNLGEAKINYFELDILDEMKLNNNSIVLTNRLHIAKLCWLAGVYCVLISYSTKTEAPELIGSNGKIYSLDNNFINISGLNVGLENHQKSKSRAAYLIRNTVSS